MGAFSTLGSGIGVIVGIGCTSCVRVGVGEGVATGIGVGVGDGVGTASFTEPIRCHTNFLFFLTHLNLMPAEIAVLPTLEQVEPDLIAANEGVRVSDKEITSPKTTFLTR